MTFPEMIQPLLERKDLSQEQARELMRYMTSGEATEAQIGGALLGLRIKGCTTRELAAFASVLRERAFMLEHPYIDLVDTCGTGGGCPSFNISTAAAIVAAAAGARIAKHGNRAVTSQCGSADVLEALGLKIGGEQEDLRARLDRDRIVFLFAPAHHPAMAHVGKARKELMVRTVFNQLGPLANPAGARRQLIGVYDPGLMRSMGEALRELGCERAVIVHGDDGLDEISPVTTTEYVKVWDGKVSTGKWSPADFGLEPLDEQALAPGATKEDNARILRDAVSGRDPMRMLAILPSAAAAIWIAGLDEDLKQAVERAKDAISSGLALAKLDSLVQAGAGK